MVPKPQLGMGFKSTKKKDGLEISDIKPTHAADRCGLRVGDIITHVNGHPTSTKATYMQAFQTWAPNKVMQFTVSRDGNTTVIPVTPDAVDGAAAATKATPARRMSRKRMASSKQSTKAKASFKAAKTDTGIDFFKSKGASYEGLIVQTVKEGSAGATAGIHKDDRIRVVNQQAVGSSTEFDAALAKMAGKTVNVELQRGDKRITVPLVVAVKQPLIGMAFLRNKNKKEGGLIVSLVTPGGPAAQGGLMKGDVLRTVNAHPLVQGEDYYAVMTTVVPGDTLEFGVDRDGKPITLQVVAGERGASQRLMGDKKRQTIAEADKQMAASPKSASKSTVTQNQKTGASRPLVGMSFCQSKGSEGGLIVYSVSKGCAMDAGIRKDDVLLSVNGKKLNTQQDYLDAIDGCQPGHVAPFIVRRDGKEMSRFVTFGAVGDVEKTTRVVVSPTKANGLKKSNGTAAVTTAAAGAAVVAGTVAGSSASKAATKDDVKLAKAEAAAAKAEKKRKLKEEAAAQKAAAKAAKAKAKEEKAAAKTAKKGKDAADDQKPNPTNGGVTDKALLGMQLSPKKGVAGLVILDCTPRCPAALSGLRSNDLLTEINGMSTESDSQYFKVQEKFVPGGVALFNVQRSHNVAPLSTHLIPVVLGSKSAFEKDIEKASAALKQLHSELAKESLLKSVSKQKIKSKAGYLVTSVASDVPNVADGLNDGDRIQVVNGQKTISRDDVHNALRGCIYPDMLVPMQVVRKKKAVVVVVTMKLAGLPVDEVVEGTPASKAGLQPGDVVFRINDRAILSRDDYVAATKGDLDMDFQVWRRNEMIKFVVPGVPVTMLRTVEEKKQASPDAVSASAAKPFMGMSFHKKKKGGLYLKQIQSGGPADKAGLRVGDKVTAINDHPTESTDDYYVAIEGVKVGFRLPIKVDRKGEMLLKVLTVGSKEPAKAGKTKVEAKQAVPAPVATAAGKRQQPLVGMSCRGKSKSDKEPGIIINSVMEGGPAKKAGVVPGDRLVSVGGQMIKTVHDYFQAASAFRPGDVVQFGLLRDGKKETVGVTVGDVGEVSEDILPGKSRRVAKNSGGIFRGVAMGASGDEIVLDRHKATHGTPSLGFAFAESKTGEMTVTQVDEGGAAALAGMQVGDIMHMLAGLPIPVGGAAPEFPPFAEGDMVPVVVEREHKDGARAHTIRIKAGSSMGAVREIRGKEGEIVLDDTPTPLVGVAFDRMQEGLVIDAVNPHGPAGNPLRKGDVIMRVNGKATDALDQYVAALRGASGKKTVEMTIFRNSTPMSVVVPLGAPGAILQRTHASQLLER